MFFCGGFFRLILGFRKLWKQLFCQNGNAKAYGIENRKEKKEDEDLGLRGLLDLAGQNKNHKKRYQKHDVMDGDPGDLGQSLEGQEQICQSDRKREREDQKVLRQGQRGMCQYL